MNAYATEENARRLYTALERPAFGFFKLSALRYEIRSAGCVIQLIFERYEPSICVILVCDPQEDNQVNESMSLWVLRHMRGVPFETEGNDKFTAFGEMLKNSFSDLLDGDFSAVLEYPTISNRIFDLFSRAQALPADHPTRQKFEAYDIRWLAELERGIEEVARNPELPDG